jgi:hypothetical protein
VQDAGEPGISGVPVTLIGAGSDGIFGTADDTLATTTTNGSGIYSFTGLPTGLYRVQLDTAAAVLNGLTPSYELDGTLNGVTTVSLAAGQNRTDVDFGFTSSTTGAPLGQLGDRVWVDANANGIQDVGEIGVAGVTLTLTGAGADGTLGTADDSVFTTTTDAAGIYTFTALVADRYRVDVVTATLPPTLTLTTYDLDGGFDDSTIVNLTTGQIRTDVDFGYVDGEPFLPDGSLGDRVWFDANADGVQDVGESGLSGVEVLLRGDGADGIFGTADDFVQAQLTDANGNYLFTNLPGDTYRVTVNPTTLSPGLIATFDLDGGLDGVTTVILPDGNDRVDVDFGYTGLGSLGDRVWLDTDADGVQDAAETGLVSVTVQLRGSGRDGLFGTADDLTLLTTTGLNGFYLFDNLPADTYRVAVVTSTLPVTLEQTYDLDGVLDSQTTVSLSAGQNRTDADFGYVVGPFTPPAGSIGDRFWFDLNGDAAQDPGEPGIAGVNVTLLGAGADNSFGTADDLLYVQTTDANGNYLFPNLPLGDYRVLVDAGTLPPGLTQTFELDGTTNGNVDVTLTAGTPTRLDVDFGYTGVGSIGDRIWRDTDRDGVQDVGETGLNNVTLALTWFGPDGRLGGGDDLTITTTTDLNGNYLFDGLPLGNYAVAVLGGVPANLTGSYELDGTLNGVTVAGLTGAIPDRRDVDFGYAATGAIGDRVWYDLDADGIQDAGETGLPIVTVRLIDAGPDGLLGTTDDLSRTTTTDANGNYLFAGLPAGTYQVVVVPPAGYIVTRANQGANDALDSDVSVTTGASPAIVLGDGEINRTIDAGLTLPATIGSRVWMDRNSDGIYQPLLNETGVPSVTVSLFDAGGNLVATVQTDANGVYQFNGLMPGDYYLQFTIPPSYTISPQNRGSDPSIDSDVDPLTGRTVVTTLDPGEVDLTWFLGLIPDTPTAVLLTDFRVVRQGDAVALSWETSLEIDTFGFHLYRSETGDRAMAVRITPQLIPGQGRNGGRYAWLDQSAPAARGVHYWLVEVERNGNTIEYGPFFAAPAQPARGGTLIFLPMVMR